MSDTRRVGTWDFSLLRPVSSGRQLRFAHFQQTVLRTANQNSGSSCRDLSQTGVSFLSQWQVFGLLDIQIRCDLVIVAGVSSVVFHILLGNHVHLQEGAEHIGVVVQNHLLKLYGHFAPLGGVKLLG